MSQTRVATVPDTTGFYEITLSLDPALVATIPDDQLRAWLVDQSATQISWLHNLIMTRRRDGEFT